MNNGDECGAEEPEGSGPEEDCYGEREDTEDVGDYSGVRDVGYAGVGWVDERKVLGDV